MVYSNLTIFLIKWKHTQMLKYILKIFKLYLTIFQNYEKRFKNEWIYWKLYKFQTEIKVS